MPKDEKTVYHDRPVTVELKEVQSYGHTFHRLSVKVGSVVVKSFDYGSNARHYAFVDYNRLLKEIDEG